MFAPISAHVMKTHTLLVISALLGAYFKGLGVPKDEKKGLGILDQACQKGFELACFELGNKYVDGRAGKVDIPKALELFDKACPGFSPACDRAQELRSQQQGNP